MKFVLNGGVLSFNQVDDLLGISSNSDEVLTVSKVKELKPVVPGVMIGREAYNCPWMFSTADRRYYHAVLSPKLRREVLESYLLYAEEAIEAGFYGTQTYTPLVKPLHNFFNRPSGSTDCVDNSMPQHELNLDCTSYHEYSGDETIRYSRLKAFETDEESRKIGIGRCIKLYKRKLDALVKVYSSTQNGSISKYTRQLSGNDNEWCISDIIHMAIDGTIPNYYLDSF
jgi:hypothetical protein